MKDLLSYTCPSDDDDTIMSSFMKQAEKLKSELNERLKDYDYQPAYPCRKIITDGKNLPFDVLTASTRQNSSLL